MARLRNPKDAADFLGVTIVTLRNWEREGKLTAERTPGGHRRYPESELLRLQNGKELNHYVIPDEVETQISAVRELAGELKTKHYTDRITAPEVREYLQSTFDDPDYLSLQGDIALVNAILSIHTRRLDEKASYSERGWKRAKAVYNRMKDTFQRNDANGFDAAVVELGEIFEKKTTIDHEREIRSWQTHKAHLNKVEQERIEKAGQYLTADQARQIAADKIQAVVEIVRARCPLAVQKEIAQAIARSR